MDFPTSVFTSCALFLVSFLTLSPRQAAQTSATLLLTTEARKTLAAQPTLHFEHTVFHILNFGTYAATCQAGSLDL